MNEIEFNIENDAALLRVNRPAARNALNWAAQEAFAEAVAQLAGQLAAGETAVRTLIITGTGNKAFVAGGDLKELSRHPEPEAAERLNRVMGQALTQLTQLPIPVLAAVNGDAFGGGCEILTACDLRLARRGTRFCFAQARNSLTTGWGGAGRLVQLLGLSRSLDLLLTSRLFSAEEAQQLGLIHRLVDPDEDVVAAARQWSADLTALPRHALASLKQLAYAATQLSPLQLAQLETELFVDLWASPDHLEALAAFIEKRRPQFNQTGD